MSLHITDSRIIDADEPAHDRRTAPDWGLFLATLAILSLGVVMVFDASYPHAIEHFQDKLYWAKRQFLFAGIGLAGMFIASRVPFWKLRALAAPLFALTFLALAAVPLVGHFSQGATRWLKFGPLLVQPSEFAKVTVVLWLAHVLTRYPRLLKDFWRGLIPLLSLIGFMFVLIERQPDLGTAIVLLFGALVLFYAAGARARWIIGLVAVCGVGFLMLAFSKGTDGYRWKRLTTFVSDDADVQKEAFQIHRSKIALGTGGVSGRGMGESREKLQGGVPAQRTDFIFCIIGEEFGLVGTLITSGLFLTFAARGLHTAYRSKSRFGSLLAVGITGMITVQALMNIAVVTASMPTTGVPLPLISYGGSSLVPTLVSIGILLNISQYPNYRDPRPLRRNKRNADAEAER